MLTEDLITGPRARVVNQIIRARPQINLGNRSAIFSGNLLKMGPPDIAARPVRHPPARLISQRLINRRLVSQRLVNCLALRTF